MIKQLTLTLSIILLSSVPAHADYKYNPFTGKLDYYEPDTDTTGAPTTAEYIVSESNATLSAEVAPSAANQVPNSSSSTAASWTATPTVTDLTVTTEAYNATNWDGDNTVPTKDAVRDKFESISTGGDDVSVNSSAATNANFLDNIYMDWAIDTTATPDDITSKFNYNAASGDVGLAANEVAWSLNGLVSEGATANTIEGRFAFPDWATSDKDITFQDATHTVVGRDTTDTLTNKTLAAADNVIGADTAEAMSGSGQVDDNDLAAGAVDGGNLGEIADGSVTEDDLGTDSVSADELNATGVETELEAALDIAGDVSSTGMSTTVIGNDKVLEVMLKAVDAAADEDILTFESTTGDFEWHTIDQMVAAMTAGALPNDSVLEADLKAVDAAVDEECLTFETTTGDFEWQACGSGTDTNAVKEYWWPASTTLPLEAADSIAPVSQDSGTNIDQLTVDFDQSTDECRTVSFKVPSDIDTGATVTFRTHWYSASVTTNNIIMDFRHNGGVAEGTDPDQALTTEASAADAVQGTAGQITVTTWTETVTNLGWSANEQVDGVFCRDANNASDTFAADSKHTGFGVEIPRA